MGPSSPASLSPSQSPKPTPGPNVGAGLLSALTQGTPRRRQHFALSSSRLSHLTRALEHQQQHHHMQHRTHSPAHSTVRYTGENAHAAAAPTHAQPTNQQQKMYTLWALLITAHNTAWTRQVLHKTTSSWQQETTACACCLSAAASAFGSVTFSCPPAAAALAGACTCCTHWPR